VFSYQQFTSSIGQRKKKDLDEAFCVFVYLRRRENNAMRQEVVNELVLLLFWVQELMAQI